MEEAIRNSLLAQDEKLGDDSGVSNAIIPAL